MTIINSTAVSASFTAPTYNGNAPIKSYVLIANGAIVGTNTGSPIVATGLSSVNTSFTVAAINDVGLGTQSSVVYATPSNTPVNLTSPTISGTVSVGQTISITNGTWSHTISSYSYQWQRNASNISGATNSTYTLQTADGGNNIRCIVTATSITTSQTANGTSANSTVAVAPTSVEYIVVAGGGGGGARLAAGGGGAGGFKTGTLSVSTGIPYTIAVGGGGPGGNSTTGSGGNGSVSSFSSISTTGGGGGSGATGTNYVFAKSGGSGGGGAGAGTYNVSGNGTIGEGYAGGSGWSSPAAGGGGGGGGGVGLNAGSAGYGANGGIGALGFSTSGGFTYYAGGGGGGSGGSGTGGNGGGGNGTGANLGTPNSPGTYGTGGGGGGGASGTYTTWANGREGGTGVVIIRYSITSAPAVSMSGGTQSSDSNYYYYTWYGAGSIQW